jgi:hypothetical protein
MAPTNSLSIVVRSEDNLVHESIIEVSEQDHPEERALIESALRAYNASSAHHPITFHSASQSEILRAPLWVVSLDTAPAIGFSFQC